MKLLFAVISEKDSKACVSNLMKEGFSVTVLASTGGFLKLKTVTLTIGTIAERVSIALDVFRATCKSRKYSNRSDDHYEPTRYAESAHSTDTINVGGATVFVLNIEEMHKI